MAVVGGGRKPLPFVTHVPPFPSFRNHSAFPPLPPPGVAQKLDLPLIVLLKTKWLVNVQLGPRLHLAQVLRPRGGELSPPTALRSLLCHQQRQACAEPENQDSHPAPTQPGQQLPCLQSIITGVLPFCELAQLVCSFFNLPTISSYSRGPTEQGVSPWLYTPKKQGVI